jgi:hypothetical protein
MGQFDVLFIYRLRRRENRSSAQACSGTEIILTGRTGMLTEQSSEEENDHSKQVKFIIIIVFLVKKTFALGIVPSNHCFGEISVSNRREHP